MKLGFTGTRQGMTQEQLFAFRELLQSLSTTELHHGDCVGADADAVDLVGAELDWDVHVVSHPPLDRSHRAFMNADEHRPQRPYLDRNHDIVDETDVLVATPAGYGEEQRSGTWATVRYARKRGRCIYIIWPLGEVSAEASQHGR